MRMRLRFGLAVAALAVATSASAAYFHEAKRDGFLWLSDLALKRDFAVTDPVPAAVLPRPDSAQILGLPPASGLYEQEGGLHIPNGKCAGDDAAIAKCERQWESANLAKAKSVASRSGAVLTLTPKSGAKLLLSDWEKCSADGECDGERFNVLGPLRRPTTVAIEIDYSHDSPSLLLFDSANGKIAGVHYGSEPTFLNGAQTMMVSSEDMNDATTLVVTRLDPDGPAIEVHCRGARSESASFGVTFKRWVSDTAFDVVLLKSGQSTAARFEKSPEGPWTLKSPEPLAGQGFECKQRAQAAKPAPAPTK